MIKVKHGDIVSLKDFPEEKYVVECPNDERCIGIFIPVRTIFNHKYFLKRASLRIVN